MAAPIRFLKVVSTYTQALSLASGNKLLEIIVLADSDSTKNGKYTYDGVPGTITKIVDPSTVYTQSQVDAKITAGASGLGDPVTSLTTNPGTPTSNIIRRAAAGLGTYVNFKRIKTGTITTTSGSAALVGVGTLFLTELAVGMSVYSGATLLGTILTITDDTHATFSANTAAVVTGVVWNGPIQVLSTDSAVDMIYSTTTGFWTKSISSDPTAAIKQSTDGYLVDQDKFGVTDSQGYKALYLDTAGNLVFNELLSQFISKLIKSGFLSDGNGNLDLSTFTQYTGDVSTGFGVTDLQGYKALYLDSLGNLIFNELLSQFNTKLIRSGFKTDSNGNLDLSVFSSYTGDQPDVFAICDPNGFIGFLLNSTSSSFVGKSSSSATPTSATIINEGIYPSDIMMLIGYGQSNATGNSFTIGDLGTDILGFVRGTDVDGVVTQYDATVATNNLAGLETFYGTDFVPITYGNGSQTEAAINTWARLIVAENAKVLSNMGVYFCGSNPSQGGTQIYQLNRVIGLNINDNPSWKLADGIVWTQDGATAYADTLYMARFLQSVWYAKRLADKQNKTFSVPVLSWVHGEAHQGDLSFQSYYDALSATITLINTLIKKITGQKNDVQFLIFQTAIFESPASVAYGNLDSISVAQLKIANDLPNAHFSFTMLPFESLATDYVHYLTLTYSLMGVYTGIQAKRLITDGKANDPIVPISYNITQNLIGGFLLEVKYKVPVLPLAFDGTQPFFASTNRQRGIRPNYGFSLKKLLNVSEEIPSTSLYSKSTAIAAIPSKYRKLSLVFKIRTNAPNTALVLEYYQYSGPTIGDSDWNTLTNWTQLTGVDETTYQLLTGVSNISITRDDTIVFKCASDPRGYFLKYGYEALSDTTGGGNLRDSQGNKITQFVVNGTYRFDNWSPIHKLEIL